MAQTRKQRLSQSAVLSRIKFEALVTRYDLDLGQERDQKTQGGEISTRRAVGQLAADCLALGNLAAAPVLHDIDRFVECLVKISHQVAASLRASPWVTGMPLRELMGLGRFAVTDVIEVSGATTVIV